VKIFDVLELQQSIKQLNQENQSLKQRNKELESRFERINNQRINSLPRNDLLKLINSSALSLTSCSGAAILLVNSNYQELNFIVQGNLDSTIKENLLDSDLLSKLLQTMDELCLTDKKNNLWDQLDSELESLCMFPFKFVDNKYAVLITSNYQEQLANEDYEILSILREQIYYLMNNLSDLKKDDNGVYLKTVTSLTNAIDAKDVYTAGHSQRVSQLAINIAQELNLKKYEIQQVEYGAILHDIGKIGISENILNKNGPLNDTEYRKIKKHPSIGVDILEDIDFLDEVFNVINYHHERIDGTGYPYGLSSSDIPLEARIVCIADAWDAMTSTRSYRRPLGLKHAVSELKENQGTQFDAQIIKKLESNKFSALVG
jgi:putative nucleotidyltransferase with HDIG domain